MRSLATATRLLLCAVLSCAAFLPSLAQAPRSFRGAWDEHKAAEIALQISRSWPNPTPGDPNAAPENHLRSNVYAFLRFDRSGVTRWLLLVAQSPPDSNCHACAPVTGAVIFTRKHEVFEATYDQPNIVDLGAFGSPPQARVQDLGHGQPAIAFELNAMAQGYAATTLILVAEVDGKLKEVLSLPTAASNDAAGLPVDQTFKWSSTLDFVPGANQEYFDVRVKTSGTTDIEDGSNSGKVRPYSSTATYHFSNGAYQPESK